MGVADTAMDDQTAAFLEDAGWGRAHIRPLAGDASMRSYARLNRGAKRALLMTAPPAAESAACPPQATDQERVALGYNAKARLAGPNLNAFVAISNALRSVGLSAPAVYAVDANRGLAIIEDLGDDLYARIVGEADETELYAAAIDVLLRLRESAPPQPASDDYAMLNYDGLALKAETDLLTEWYWPLKKGAPIGDDLQAEYQSIIEALVSSVSPPTTIVLRDYHAENLLWLPERHGVARVGLIDFQDGLIGVAAYDLASLLEDARRDVAPALVKAMIERYCAGASGNFSREAFMNDYAVLAAQRNAKIIGIFARLAERDGKPRYLDLLPRVEAHFRGDLARPALRPLRAFFSQHLPDLAP